MYMFTYKHTYIHIHTRIYTIKILKYHIHTSLNRMPSVINLILVFSPTVDASKRIWKPTRPPCFFSSSITPLYAYIYIHIYQVINMP
jgi:hypothetical protein